MAYYIHEPSGARYENGSVYFDQSGDDDFVTFLIQARQDFDNDDNTVMITIDEANLPDGFHLGENYEWELTIIDNSRRSISFVVPSGTEGHLDAEGGLNLSPRIGETFVVQLRSSIEEYIETCTKFAANTYLDDPGYDSAPKVSYTGFSGIAQGKGVVLDDHARGKGDGDNVGVGTRRINN